MNEVTIIQEINPVEVFAKEGGADGVLEAVKKQVSTIDRDISTAKGRDNIRSLAYAIARSKTAADEAGKLLKAEHQKVVDLVDAERKRLRDGLDAIKDEVRAPLTEWENAEKDRVKGHEDAIQCIEALTTDLPDDPAAIQQRIDLMAAHADRDWQEFAMRADKTLTTTRAVLDKAHAAAVNAEADRAELERLRREQAEREQKEREERIAAEAAAAAKAEAERLAAEQAAQAAASAKAEQDRLEREKAEAQARAEKAEADRLAQEQAAETARIEAERLAAEREAAAAQAERDRQSAEAKAIADAEAARAADKAHKAKVNNEAVSALVAAGLTDEQAKTAIIAIASGKVPNVAIRY